MVLEYHLIGEPEAQWRRTPQNFKADLEMLRADGYYPVTLQDFLTNRMNVPAGKTPVVITFDDSSAGQFRYIGSREAPAIDPNSAVGIMEQFAREHPDFPAHATFFVLPGIGPKLSLFGQPEYIGKKLQFLSSNGYEIGSHTFWHQNLSKCSDADVQKQLVMAEQAIQKYVPNYKMRAIALPYGVMPHNALLARSGEYQGHRYAFNAALLVGAGPAWAPGHVGFDPFHLPRIQAGDHSLGPAAFISYFKKHPDRRYISDGDPRTVVVPTALSPQLSRQALRGVNIVSVP